MKTLEDYANENPEEFKREVDALDKSEAALRLVSAVDDLLAHLETFSAFPVGAKERSLTAEVRNAQRAVKRSNKQ